MIKIKICGLRRKEDILIVNNHGYNSNIKNVFTNLILINNF